MLRESLDEALEQLGSAGIERGGAPRSGGGVSVELVLTAHPTEALPRTVLEKHRRIGGLLSGSTTRGSPRGSALPVELTIAEEVTILWQTDEVRSSRPRVVDEIRQGLWFLEESLWDAARPDRGLAASATRSRSGSAPGSAATSTGTRTRSGDGSGGGRARVDGRSRASSSRRPRACRLVGDVDQPRRRRRGRRRGALPVRRTRRALSAAADRDLGAAWGGRIRGRRGIRAELDVLERAFAGTAAHGWPTAGWRPSAAAGRLRAHGPSLDVRIHAAPSGTTPTGAAACSPRRPPTAAYGAAGDRHADRLDDADRRRRPRGGALVDDAGST